MKRLLCTALLATLIAIPAMAGPVKPKWISAKAQWAAHIDLDAARDSKLGQFIIEHRDEFDIDFGELEEMGINPLEDFYSVTLYGTRHPEKDGVVIIQMNDTVDDLIEMALAEAPDFKEIDILGRTGYSMDNGETVAYVHRSSSGKRTIVLTNDIDRLAHAIRVIEGDRDNVTKKHPDMKSPRKGTILIAHAAGVPWLTEDDNPASRIIEMSEDISVQIGEYQNEAFAQVRFTVPDEDNVRNIKQIIEGVLALGRMVASSDPDSEIAPFADFLDGIKIRSEDGSIQLSCAFAADALLEVIGKAMQEAHDEDDEDEDEDEDDEDEDWDDNR